MSSPIPAQGRKFSHRARVTVKSTAFASLILAVLLVSVGLYLQNGLDQLVVNSTERSLHFFTDAIKHTPPGMAFGGDPGSGPDGGRGGPDRRLIGPNGGFGSSREDGSNPDQANVSRGFGAPVAGSDNSRGGPPPRVRNQRLTVGLYDSTGKLKFSNGRGTMPNTLGTVKSNYKAGIGVEKMDNGDTAVVTLDFNDREMDLRHVYMIFLILWPILTALMGVVTFFSVSSSFRPLHKLLDQADHMSLSDRLTTPDQAEFGELAGSINKYLDTIQKVVYRQEEFAVDAAHELCTPLTALRGNLEVALKKQDPDALRAAAKKSIEQVERLQRLVEGLLLAARPSQGAITACQADEVVEEVQARWVDQFSAKQVRLEATTEPFRAAMRLEELEAVMNNLLANALKFSPPNSSVTISLFGNGRLLVHDEGPGIPETMRESVFDRFERGESKKGGFGIGLYLVKRLLEQRKGTVSALPSEKGALIEIILSPS